jgi:hypothetical protein
MLKVATTLLLAGTVAHALPVLEPGVYIQNGGTNLQVSYCSAPTVVDWNNDGRKDLVVGQFTSGNVWRFLNVGTDANPVFNGGSLIQCAGTNIATTYG